MFFFFCFWDITDMWNIMYEKKFYICILTSLMLSTIRKQHRLFCFRIVLGVQLINKTSLSKNIICGMTSKNVKCNNILIFIFIIFFLPKLIMWLFISLGFSNHTPTLHLCAPSRTQLQPYQPVSGIFAVVLHLDVAHAGRSCYQHRPRPYFLLLMFKNQHGMH